MDAMMRVRALVAGRAQPATSHRHVIVQRDALVFAPLLMNGEDISIHIAAVGRRGDTPRLLWVPDPRDRRARDGLLAHLAEIVDDYFLARAREGTYPQVWVSSPAAVTLIEDLATSLRHSREDPHLRRLGELLTFPAERYYLSGQQTLQAATDALARHYVVGQDPSEGAHLAVALAWHAGLDASSIFDAVRVAETRPGGVKTLPLFDEERLVPVVRAYHKSVKVGDAAAAAAAAHRIYLTLEPEVGGLYRGIERAIDLLVATDLPPLPCLAVLEAQEASAFARFMRHRARGAGIAGRDSPRAAAGMLTEREERAAGVEAAVLIEDRVARARGRLDGRVLVGRVTRATATKIASRKVEIAFALAVDAGVPLRPRAGERWHDVDGEGNSGVEVEIDAVERSADGVLVACIVRKGMRAKKAPSIGDTLELVREIPDWHRRARVVRHVWERLAALPATHSPGVAGPTPPQRVVLPPDSPGAAVRAVRTPR
jgi:hypothetical protein